jgi:gluconokinase
MNASVPRSAYDETSGLVYFARMLDKIRKHARGELREDFHGNLGSGMDGRLCDFMRVDYAALVKRTLEGGSDEEILAWCGEQSGRPLSDVDKLLWNDATRKRGWRDPGTATIFLERQKAESGLTARTDLLTMFDFFDVDEGRKE